MPRAYLLSLALLLVVACSKAGAGGCSKGTLYVQSAEVPFWKDPSWSEQLATLPIGTRCELLQRLEYGRLQLRCGEHEGYAYEVAFGSEKPEVEALLQAPANPKVGPCDRAHRATQAVALDPANPHAWATLKKQYLDCQFDLLKDSKASEYPDPTPLELECEQDTAPADCLAEKLLPGDLFPSRMVEFRGADFIGVGVQENRLLYVVRGELEHPPAKAAGHLTGTLHSRDYGGMDVPRVAKALGLKPAPGSKRIPRYVADDGIYNPPGRSGKTLSAEDKAGTVMLIDLEKNIPAGRKGERRDDLRLIETLNLLLVGDFDQNGRDDALVFVWTGGNRLPPCYLFASVTAQGKPVVTNSFCSWKDPPLLELAADGEATFTVTEGEDEGIKKTFTFSRGRARTLP